MIITGWGKYPKIDCNVTSPTSVEEILSLLKSGTVIARGAGRSYGDSALNSNNTIKMQLLDNFISFNKDNGVLTVGAGVHLRDIIEIFLPLGWFLPVTPGTSWVTIGGAIASDVHGKNHHIKGTFCSYVDEIELLLGSGEIVKASPHQKSDLFHATCGGMGLTGIIITAKIQLERVKSSYFQQKTIKARSIDELIELFNANSDAPFSVAWMDCLTRGKGLGRSLLILAKYRSDNNFEFHQRRTINIPNSFPSFILNKWNIKIFNTLYYYNSKQEENTVSLLDYYYPLDKLNYWNNMYGKKGFVQYQFVIPKENALFNLREILNHITDSGEGSFLAVFKLFGEQNQNLLTFPMKGYSLALDFKISDRTIKLLSYLDDMIADMGGRVYLTKDALISKHTFKRMYQKISTFEDVRLKYGAISKFSSAQSIRLGLK